MSRTVPRPSHWRKLLVVLVVACLGLIIIAGAGVGSRTNLADANRTPLASDGHQYPAVVAYVNGKPITGTALAQRVRIVRQSPHVTSDPSQFSVERIALEQLVYEAVLIDSAKDVGVTVSEQEAASAALDQQNAILNGDDPAARRSLAAAAAQLGISAQDFATDPRTIDTYRQGMILGRMYDYVLGTLPQEQRTDPVAFQQAVVSFVQQHAKNVQVLIQP